MPSHRWMKNSFASGELAPRMHGRTDLEQYQYGYRHAENFLVLPHGGVANRPGLEFITKSKDQDASVRLIPFTFSTTQTYMLEFGDLYMRVIREGGQIVTLPGFDIADITPGNPPVVATDGNHNFLAGDEVYIDNVGGAMADDVNGDWYTVANPGAADFELSGITGAGWGAAEAGTGEVTYGIKEMDDTDPIEMTTTAQHSISNGDHFVITGLAGMIEVNNQVFIAANVSGDYVELTDMDSNDVDGTGYTAGIETDPYPGRAEVLYEIVTPYASEDLSDLRFAQSGDVVVITHRDYRPRTLSRTAHDAWALDVKTFEPDIGTPQSLAANPSDAGDYKYMVTAVHEETAEESEAAEVTCDYAGGEGGVTLTWDAVTNAGAYNVYRDDGGSYRIPGFIGTTSVATFYDPGNNDSDENEGKIEPEWSISPPMPLNPFGDPPADDSGNNPAVVSYYEQRCVYAGSLNDPQKVWMSQSAAFDNFWSSRPGRDGDAIIFRVQAREANFIQNLVPMRDLLIMTSGGEWKANGGESEMMTATGGLAVRQQTHNGSGGVDPIVAGNTVIYYSDVGPAVWDATYTFAEDVYKGTELSLLARHLLDNYQIEEWTFAKSPFGTVWGQRNDGKLICLTFQKEHKVWAWHKHSTRGYFESVASVREGAENVVYFAVRRRINDVVVRTIERMKSRLITDQRDAFFVDCGLSYNEPITILKTGFTGVGGDVPYVDVSVEDYTAYNLVADEIIEISDVMDDGSFESAINGNLWAIESTSLVDGKRRILLKNKDTDVALDGCDGDFLDYPDPTGFVRKAVITLNGAGHLNGQTIKLLVDGRVHPDVVVTNGIVTLDYYGARVHAGIGYHADMQLLDIDIPSKGGSIQGLKSNVNEVTLRVQDSVGAWIGPDEDNLLEVPWRVTEDAYVGPPRILTGDIEPFPPEPDWSLGARLWIQQREPLPLTINAIMAEVQVGT